MQHGRPFMIGGPSDLLEDLLEGRTPPDQAHPAILSWSRLHVYKAACWVLSGATKEERKSRLNESPAHARKLIEEEAKRVWRYRSNI